MYNTNSSLIHRFQRGPTPYQTGTTNNASLESSTNTSSNDDTRFVSDYPINSSNYLRELCCSVYPASLHARIQELEPSPDLEIIAFSSLIVLNFIKFWYGPKVLTRDHLLLVQLYDYLEEVIKHFKSRSKSVDLEKLLLDDIPAILGTHVKAISTIMSAHDTSHAYERYLSISLFDSMTDDKRYPYVLTDLLQNALDSNSALEITFFDSLSNSLLLGRVMDSIAEPYYVLRGLSKLSLKLQEYKKETADADLPSFSMGILSRVRHQLLRFFQIGSTLFLNAESGTAQQHERVEPLLSRYIFRLLETDILQLDRRKPFLYACSRYLRAGLARFTVANELLSSAFRNFIYSKLWNGEVVAYLFNEIRRTLFPQDNMMGPRTIIPTGREFEDMKLKTAGDVWDTCKFYSLDIILGITKEDTRNFIEGVCLSKDANKVLYFRLLECFLAHIADK